VVKPFWGKDPTILLDIILAMIAWLSHNGDGQADKRSMMGDLVPILIDKSRKFAKMKKGFVL
jgi:hypothetical protein